jgi:hypothetical protein
MNISETQELLRQISTIDIKYTYSIKRLVEYTIDTIDTVDTIRTSYVAMI